MNRRIKTLLFLMFCGGLLIGHPFPAHSNPLDPYIQAAKKEGAVTLGIALRSKLYGKPVAEKYVSAFQNRYPFLKVTPKRIGGMADREKILNEMVSGKIDYDVSLVSTTQVPTIAEAKLPRVVEWEKLGIPKFLIHPDNYGILMRAMVRGIAYNRNLIPDEMAKTFTWETCTEPKWKAKCAVDDRPRHLEIFYQDDVWGREKTLNYAKRWAANKPVMEASRSTAANKLKAGAYHFMCGLTWNQVRDLQVYAGSQSVGIVFPEPIPVEMAELVYVPDKAKHPNAGILFLAWSGTKEANNLLDEINFTGHPAFEGSEVNEVLKGKKIAYATWENIIRSDEILTEILKAMGFPVVRAKKKK